MMVGTRIGRAVAAVAAFGAMTASSFATDWSPPIGIPSPSFGIFETAPATPNPWTIETPGFYYVDATKSGNTDSNNPLGTPARPRSTIPTDLAGGAVVELHGTYDAPHASPATITASGTESKPVFIRGVSGSSRPLVRRNWEVRGSYLILENLEFGPTPDQSATGSLVIRLPASHVVLRHSEVHGTPTEGGIGVVDMEVPWGQVYTGPGVIDSVVIFDNIIHDNGDVNATFDQDVHGIAVSDHVTHLWVVDNQMFRNSGDGIQINAGTGQDATTHHIYVARNVSHHNKQSGFWVKQATDVIFSQNESYGHRPSDSSEGQCMGAQYGPDWVWFLFNHAHDCDYGIHQASDNGQPSHTFIIGNVIENVHHSQPSDPSDAWGPAAIMMSGGYERHVVGNTIYDVDSGVNIPSPSGSLEMADNIVASVTQPQASHLILGFESLAANTAFHHNLLFGDPRVDIGVGQWHLNSSLLAISKSIDADPEFVDARNGNFHIPLSSPAANSGELNPAYAAFQQRYSLNIAVDSDGRARPQIATADMGAYLAGSAAVSITPVPAPPTVPASTAADACVPTSMPSAPEGLALVTQGRGAVRVSWTKPSGCGIPTSYIVEGGVAPGDPGVSREVGASATSYQGAMQPGTFYVRVKARNPTGISQPSNEIQVGGVPGAPGALKAVINGGSLTLSWNAPTTGGTPSGFVVEAGSTPGRTDTTTTYSATTTSTTSQKPKSASYFRVRAISVAGLSEPSNEVKVGR